MQTDKPVGPQSSTTEDNTDSKTNEPQSIAAVSSTKGRKFEFGQQVMAFEEEDEGDGDEEDSGGQMPDDETIINNRCDSSGEASADDFEKRVGGNGGEKATVNRKQIKKENTRTMRMVPGRGVVGLDIDTQSLCSKLMLGA